YESNVGIYPPGTFLTLTAIRPLTTTGPVVHLLPYLDQSQTYNAINFSMNIFYLTNRTVHATGISTLWCPSDSTVGEVKPLPDDPLVEFASPSGSNRMAYSSYAGVCGPWYVHTFSIPGVWIAPWHAQQKSVQIGMFNVCSDVRVASVTDGLSNTML